VDLAEEEGALVADQEERLEEADLVEAVAVQEEASEADEAEASEVDEAVASEEAEETALEEEDDYIKFIF